MTVLYILFVILILAIFISVFVIITNDNINEYTIRINEAEANIESTLNKRFDLLNKSIDIIKEVTEKDGEILNTISEIRSQKLDNFTLDKALYKAIEEFHQYAENNQVLKENDKYTNIEIDLLESESEIISLKKYYNDIIEKYNKITSQFPTIVMAKLKKYNAKPLFILEDHTELINSLK